MSEVTPGRRERKKMQTREAIRAHAMRLFAERGFEETTLQDITDAADLAPRTFFLHFASKEELVFGDAQERLDLLRQALRDRPEEEDAFTAIRAAAISLFRETDVLNEDARLMFHLMQQAPTLFTRDAAYTAEGEDVLTREIARRCGLDPEIDVYPRLLSSCTLNALRVSFFTWNSRDGAQSLAQIAAEALDVLSAGLRVPPARPGDRFE